MFGVLLLTSQALLPSLPSLRAPVSGTASCSTAVPVGRRALLQNVGVAAVAVATSGMMAAPPALAANKAPVIDLKAELMLILRVQEACSQELRLIQTGKYRELQRLDIKRAIGNVTHVNWRAPCPIKPRAHEYGNRCFTNANSSWPPTHSLTGMMLDNYDLAGRFNKAASAASKEQVRVNP